MKKKIEKEDKLSKVMDEVEEADQNEQHVLEDQKVAEKQAETETVNTEDKVEVMNNDQEIFKQVLNAVSVNKSTLAELLRILKENNERNNYKDESILRMQKQIYEYEKDLKSSIKETLIKEILSFYNIFLDFQNKYSESENKSLIDEIDYLDTELSNILFNNGIDEIDLVEGDELDRMRQRIKSKLFSDDAKKDKTIHKIIKKGFIWNDKVIQKQEVEIYITNNEESNG